MSQRRPNRLKDEVSLYLQQHAHNPIDWYPWGPEALQKARREDKPIIVSIGYSACHWCHVMERESFEDPEVAQLMNANFVCIKVDREERPDVDAMYMDAVVVMTGQGGWPLNCFLLPDGRPFYGGTYFPPTPRYGRPSWKQLLTRITDFYDNRREDLTASAEQLVAHLERPQLPAGQQTPPGEIVEESYAPFAKGFDKKYGGFGGVRGAPKFPNVSNLELMLRAAARGQEGALELVELQADQMARGGIRDHLGGGFHRYSTDRVWLVPHFEKMLYDNALLPRVYVELHRLTGHARHAEVVGDVFAYLEREMQAPGGGFYATQDADSEGEEGKFFVWSRQEVEAALGQELAEVFCQAYDVTEGGNWEGKNILHLAVDLEELARERGEPLAALESQLGAAREALFAAREERIKPSRDEKQVCAWNGLAILAYARAACVLGETHYGEVGETCADFVRAELWDERRLKRVFAVRSDGETVVKINAFLDDYAYVAHGLVDLYKATGRPEDMELACDLIDVVLDRFFDPESGEMFLTAQEADELPVRKRAEHDNATPSPAGECCLALMRLHALTGRERYLDAVEAALRHSAVTMDQLPLAVPSLINALELYHGGVGTVVVVGERHDERTRALLDAARRYSGPDDNVVFAEPGGPHSPLVSPELLQGRLHVEEPTAYPCRGLVCEAPVRTVEELRERLKAQGSRLEAQGR